MNCSRRGSAPISASRRRPDRLQDRYRPRHLPVLRLGGQRRAVEYDTVPTCLDEIADVLVVAAVGVVEHFLAVIIAEAVQGLLLRQAVLAREREQFARAVVLPGAVAQRAVSEWRGGEVVQRVDHGHRVVECDAVWGIRQALQE